MKNAINTNTYRQNTVQYFSFKANEREIGNGAQSGRIDTGF